ncbi:MAG: hypothetical protein WEA04_01310 [Candidatus Andersenbacteria bacterium]
MKIEGVIRVEGVDLHVDAEVADAASHIYVTNVHPSTLVIPPERLELRYLALSKAALTALEAKSIKTLADLVDQQGSLRPMKLSTTVKAEVEGVLGALRKAALVFDWNEQATKDQMVVDPSLIQSPGTSKRDVKVEEANGVHVNGQVKKLKLEEILAGKRPGTRKRLLSVQQLESLQDQGVATIGDLLAFGEEKLLMTRGFDLTKIAELKEWLQSHGAAIA